MADINEKEAKKMIRDLSKKFGFIFKGVKKSAKLLPKEDFIAQNVAQAKMAGPMIGHPKVTDSDARLVLSVGWDMIRSGEV